MDSIDRRIIIGAGALTFLLVVASFLLGRATASTTAAENDGIGTTVTTEIGTASDDEPDSGSGDDGAPGTTVLEEIPFEEIDGDPGAALPPEATDPSDIPEFGTAVERDDYVKDLAEAGLAWTSRSAVLAAADHICYNLQRLEELRRSPAFATRVVWNESLLELDEADLRAWAAVWRTAPSYLCPDSVEYAEEVSYWLGF